MRIDPTSWGWERLRQYVQAVIDSGLYTPPNAMTAEEVVERMDVSPIGTVSLIGESDVDRVEISGRAEMSERGWIQDLRG